MINLLKRVRGPAVVYYKGQAFYTKDVIAVDPQLSPFELPSDAYGPLARRHNQRNIQVQFTPVGVYTANPLAVLYHPLHYKFGSYNTPTYDLEQVTAEGGILQIPDHRIITGTGVRVGGCERLAVLPGGLAENVTYYARSVDADTVTLHTTEAGAVNNANAVVLANAGSGRLGLIQNSPLIVHSFNGWRLIIWNAAPTAIPSLNLRTVESVIGQATFTGYGVHASEWSAENSLYTLEPAPFIAPGINPDDILTVPFKVDWGTIIGITPREAIAVDFGLETAEVSQESEGIICHSITSVTATAKFVPTNFDLQDMMSDLDLQGAGNARGKNLPTGTLNIYGPGNNPYIRIYGAALTNPPSRFGSTEDRVGELTFESTRTFAGGSPNPIAYIGTSAPA